ncbi:hypothetical protein CATRI_01865 [Corynebacterium atrinae]|uniref:hypothetical protein n=1 Tax=Corynebacterium atrinae TaxID=1336740 RepID=UPI0025B3377B|nr:hypothetical protein [Corynebacterium atrinae]WJY62478.1 hypothetical protein CATRI_01865 [Corynebacterium atrinae]
MDEARHPVEPQGMSSNVGRGLNFPAIVFFTLWIFCILLALSRYFGFVDEDMLALAMIASLLFGIAGVLSIVTFWAPTWLLVSLAIIGAVTAAVGIYYVVTVPMASSRHFSFPLGWRLFSPSWR